MATTHRFEHSTSRYGENLAMMGSGTRSPCVNAVDRWYEENEQYDYLQNVFIFNAGHFTQLVWYSTTEIGVGIATSNKGVTYVTMLYNPPGNVLGRFTQNVFAPKRPNRPAPNVFAPNGPSQRQAPPYPPILQPPPIDLQRSTYTLEIKTSTKTCKDMIVFISCELRYTGGSGSYYTVKIASDASLFKFKKYILDRLRHNFQKSETISLYDKKQTKIIYRVSGSQSQS